MNTKLECNKFVYNDEDKSRLKWRMITILRYKSRHCYKYTFILDKS